MTVHLATDHAGFSHKELLKAHLLERGYEVVDHGATELNGNDDYPDFITPCAKAISENADVKGVVFGGSGQGEAMCANRIEGVRAVVYYGGDTDILRVSREHNDANILSIGARFVSAQETLSAVDLWLDVSFSGEERHTRRLAKF